MKLFLAILILGLSSNLFAKQAKQPVPQSSKSRFVYLESYPNSDKEIIIQSIKCNPKINDFKIERFETESKVTNGTVNVINIYARSGDCKLSPYSSVWSETIRAPKNGKHTHIYITILSDNIMVL